MPVLNPSSEFALTPRKQQEPGGKSPTAGRAHPLTQHLRAGFLVGPVRLAHRHLLCSATRDGPFYALHLPGALSCHCAPLFFVRVISNTRIKITLLERCSSAGGLLMGGFGGEYLNAVSILKKKKKASPTTKHNKNNSESNNI